MAPLMVEIILIGNSDQAIASIEGLVGASVTAPGVDGGEISGEGRQVAMIAPLLRPRSRSLG